MKTEWAVNKYFIFGVLLLQFYCTYICTILIAPSVCKVGLYLLAMMNSLVGKCVLDLISPNPLF